MECEFPVGLEILRLEEGFLGLHTPCFLGSSKCKSEDDCKACETLESFLHSVFGVHLQSV